MDVVRIPLADTMRFGGRDVDAATVRMLSESMAAVGQMTPILVRRGKRQEGPTSKDTYWIIAGRHRVQAARELGWAEIDAVLADLDTPHAELCEIDENLVRAELSDAERAKAHARREELMVQLGLAAPGRRGGDRRSNDNSSLGSYAKDTAEALGVHRRTVQRDLRRAKTIEPEVLDDITGTDLDKGVVLDELARAPRSQQVALLDEIRQRQEGHKVNREVNKAIALTDAQLFAEWLMARTDLNELDTVISWLEGTKPRDVIAALRREAA